MEQKIHMESALDALVRLAPLRDKHSLRKSLVKKAPDILPQRDGPLGVLIVLHQRPRHIHAESVAPQGEPERHHVLHGISRGHCSLGIHGLLPRAVRLVEAVIERRLVREKVHDTAAVPVGDSPKGTVPRRLLPDAVRPDIAVCEFIGRGFHALRKPRMLPGRMPGNKVKKHMHSELVRLREQRRQVLVGSVPRRHLVIVRDIVARVPERGVKAGIQPNGVASQVADIGQFLRDSVDVADPVPVRVQKGLRVNLVKYGV